MARRIALTDSPTRRINVTASPTRRVSAAVVAKGLGAEDVGSAPAEGKSPASFLAVREEAFHRLRSTGGRPGLEGAERKKIPLMNKDWRMIETVASHISEPGFRPSAGQVASILLTLVLREMDASSLEATVKRHLKSDAVHL
ncbi:MAG: hypothetical protein JSR47_16010 [Proteobacteria bacterium]|nr:hypothetical protein [Pseudomonadota bacterium]MBS0548796.1 hypothetical protein [Pseudomonadota bacterium]